MKMAIREMIAKGCEEVVLEAEVSNTGALKLYQALGFVRDKRLHRCGGHTGLEALWEMVKAGCTDREWAEEFVWNWLEEPEGRLAARPFILLLPRWLRTLLT